MSRLIFFLLLVPVDVWAHGTSKSFAEWTITPRSAVMRINYAAHDLAAAVPGLDQNQDKQLSLEELDAGRTHLGERAVAHTQLSVSEKDADPRQPCSGEVTRVQGLGDPVVTEVRVRVVYSCPTRIGALEVSGLQLPELEPPHITVATFIAGADTAQHIFTPTAKTFRIQTELPSIEEELSQAALAGLAALFAPASLLFLLGLLLFERPKSIVVLTLLYGIGLFAAAFLPVEGGLWLSILLALSVLFVGGALIARRDPSLPIYKPAVALPFALLHGLVLSVPGDLAHRIAGLMAQLAASVLIGVACAVMTVLLGDRVAGYRRPAGIAWLCGAGALVALLLRATF